MSAKLLILAAAEEDIGEAFVWYERQQAGLGHEFLRAVDAAINAIRRRPEMGGFIERHFRGSLLGPVSNLVSASRNR